jgi:hypothetical protein
MRQGKSDETARNSLLEKRGALEIGPKTQPKRVKKNYF